MVFLLRSVFVGTFVSLRGKIIPVVLATFFLREMTETSHRNAQRSIIISHRINFQLSPPSRIIIRLITIDSFQTNAFFPFPPLRFLRSSKSSSFAIFDGKMAGKSFPRVLHIDTNYVLRMTDKSAILSSREVTSRTR